MKISGESVREIIKRKQKSCITKKSGKWKRKFRGGTDCFRLVSFNSFDEECIAI